MLAPIGVEHVGREVGDAGPALGIDPQSGLEAIGVARVPDPLMTMPM